MSRINWPRFLNLALLFSLVGCTSFDPASPQPTQIAEVSTPLLSPTAVPPYIHYDSSKGPNIHLEFDYPGSWIFGTRIEADMVIISLADPRFLTLPTPSYDGIHPVPNDFGSVDIWVMPLQAGQTPDTELESHKKSYSETWWIKVLDDYKTTIDGYDANVLE